MNIMARLAASLLLVLLAVSQTSTMELTATNSISSHMKIPLIGNHGTFEIKNQTTSNAWQLIMNPGVRLKIESQVLCLDCADTLTISTTTTPIQVLWDVNTVHRLITNNTGPDSVCTEQQTYCILNIHSNPMYTTHSPLVLQFNRHGAKDIKIAFEFWLYSTTTSGPNTNTNSNIKFNTKPTNSKMDTTTGAAATVTSSYMLWLALLLILFYC